MMMKMSIDAVAEIKHTMFELFLLRVIIFVFLYQLKKVWSVAASNVFLINACSF